MCNLATRYVIRTHEKQTFNNGNILTASKRLIPDTEHYLADVFTLLGVTDPTPSDKPTPTPTVTPSMSIKAEHGKPENIKATPVVSSSTTVTTHPAAAFTTVIRHGNTKPIENIQIGSGWSGKKKLTAEDLPVIFDAVSRELARRFRNMIDSSDEVGLGDDSDLLGYLR